eukprot:CAMPEP_0177497998 /NCGR_PEP_ID=MMETSP0369-20130122/35344_1 /TAXON_ID=447022 ORGANISM="Scrippsiella hangoei-like, Strain SHHI-4" /NCGR_SAMPLE_ID=MMETSP0369 /ASSEMBLY_ACC=CAM_ASM_000364 /LENGTH=105 /DNA_ID=CAMNT_0018975183 /DNA_START=38 /DNA_END=351 /DNA_ORIENTATION=+
MGRQHARLEPEMSFVSGAPAYSHGNKPFFVTHLLLEVLRCETAADNEQDDKDEHPDNGDEGHRPQHCLRLQRSIGACNFSVLLLVRRDLQVDSSPLFGALPTASA